MVFLIITSKVKDLLFHVLKCLGAVVAACIYVVPETREERTRGDVAPGLKHRPELFRNDRVLGIVVKSIAFRVFEFATFPVMVTTAIVAIPRAEKLTNGRFNVVFVDTAARFTLLTGHRVALLVGLCALLLKQ